MTTNNQSRVQPLDAKQLSHSRTLLTTKEVSGLTGFSSSFFEKGRVYGYGPNFIRVRGKILYHFDALNKWLADHECEPKGAPMSKGDLETSPHVGISGSQSVGSQERLKYAKYPNPYQPQRPIYDHAGNALSFRTHISRPDSGYDLYDQRNVICQTQLYRWVKRKFVNGTPIADLHGHLFWDQPSVSKRHLGSTILQSVAYNPRKLKGETRENPKACMTYVFLNPKDLEYGLEWMISIWIRKVTLADTPKEVDDALTELGEVSSADVQSLFWDPLMQPVVRGSITKLD